MAFIVSIFYIASRQFKTLLSGLSLLLCAVSCQNEHTQQSQQEIKNWLQPNGHVKVLATTAMIQDIVKQIGGPYVDSLTLIKGELDPHSYQLVKGDDEKLRFADLIFYNGLGLEHGPSLQYFLQHDPKAIPLGNRIQEKDPGLIIDVHGQPDPHIWMDVSLWSKIIPFITEALIQKDPTHANEYRHNAEQLIATMNQANQEIKKEMQTIPPDQRFLVTSHDAFNYFARAYLATDHEKENGQWQQRMAAPEGLAPESQLSTTDIQHILNHLIKYRITVLFPESNVSKDSIRKIVQAGKEKGLNLIMAQETLYGDAMGKPGLDGDTYLKMLQHNARVIAHYLSLSNQKTEERG